MSLRTGVARVLLEDYWARIWARPPRKVDLAPWSPPDTPAARAAEDHLREVSSPEMVEHSFRTYYFSAIAYELALEPRPELDREALYVAALMHDVGLFDPAGPPACFSVAGARRARRLMTDAGWPKERQDRVAVAITSPAR